MIFHPTKSRASNKGNASASLHACVYLKDWWIEIFKGVVTTSSSFGQLQTYRESWVTLCNIDDLLDRIDRGVLKRRCVSTRSSQYTHW